VVTIEQYLAAGGTITHCPTVYLLPITGAAPIRSGVSDRVMEGSLPLKQRKRKSKEEWLARARTAKKAKGSSPRELQALADYRERRHRQAVEEAAKLLAMWDRGEPLEEIARLRGCSVATVKKLLRKAGASVVSTARNQVTGKITELPGDGLELHHQGYTAKQIADKVKLDHSTVRRILRENGLTPHRIGPRDQPRSDMLKPEVVAEIVRLYEAGLGSLKIRNILGIAKSTVLVNLRRLGIQPRPPKLKGDGK
jgi:DNA invertase Pin-like site-specific DNA recombinase